MSDDLVNSLFEFGGAIALLFNIRRLLIDRELKGISWLPVLFFTTWGFWNLRFYSNLDQQWSFRGACAIVVANSVWLAMLAYFHACTLGTDPIEKPCVSVSKHQETLSKHAVPTRSE